MRALVWGFEGAEGELFLQALQTRGIQPVLHISDGLGDADILSYFNLHDRHFEYHSLGRDFYRIRENLGSHRFRFTDFFSRHFPVFTMAFHDYQDAYEVMLRKCYHLLLTHRVELVIFLNVPHEGTDWLFYLLAQEMGIKTVFFFQTLFPNRQFVLSCMEDYENLWARPEVADAGGPKIVFGGQEALFYMGGVPAKGPTKPQSSRIRRLFVKLGFDRFLRITPTTARLRDESFRKELSQVQLSPDQTVQALQGDFVYFPLAMQPEMTTSAIGAGFEDQIAALEALRDWIPSDWKILVKENPKQTCLQRGSLFFRRLREIPGLYVVAPSTSTYKLIRESKLVSVVTGTAGWEALRFGKPVLIFGHAWYKGLPGVYQYRDTKDWFDLRAFSFDLEALQVSFDRLIRKADYGISDLAYRAIYPEYMASVNATLLADSVVRTIKGW